MPAPIEAQVGSSTSLPWWGERGLGKNTYTSQSFVVSASLKSDLTATQADPEKSYIQSDGSKLREQRIRLDIRENVLSVRANGCHGR